LPCKGARPRLADGMARNAPDKLSQQHSRWVVGSWGRWVAGSLVNFPWAVSG
jgi:hypothetical protein